MIQGQAGDVRTTAIGRVSLLAAPFAVAAGSILSIYTDSGSPLEGTYRALGIALILILAAEAVLGRFVGMELAAALVCLLVILVFKQIEVGAAALVLSAGLVAWSWIQTRSLPSRSNIGGLVRTASSLLLIATIVRGVGEGALGLPMMHATGVEAPTVDGRDVIVVLLDGYPRSDTLASRFSLDNAPFLDALEERGFDISRRSRSNYPLTALTLASMFEMRHIEDMPSLASETGYAEGYRAVSRVLSGPLRAIETFRRHGYEAVGIPAVVNEFRLGAVDTDLDSGDMVQLETVILGKTLLAPVVNWFAPELIHQQQRDRSLKAIAAVEAAVLDPRQQLVFAHLMLPHSPFVFGREGEPIPQPECVPTCSIFEGPSDKDAWVGQYGDQVLFTNDLLLGMVDSLLAGGQEPVVILMSDHGARAWREEDPGEMLLNFFAAYTPEAPRLFPDDATPINVFPRLIRQYLDEPVPLLPDRFFLPGGYGPLVLKLVD